MKRRRRRRTAGVGADGDSEGEKGTTGEDGGPEDDAEGVGGQERAQPVDEAVELEQTKDAEGGHVLGRLDGLETDEVDLHGEQSSEGVDRAVGDVEAAREAAGDQQREDVQRDQVDDEDVASPRGHHVEVGQRAHGSPEERAGVDRLDPAVVGEDEGEDGNAFVIKRTSDRTRDVT